METYFCPADGADFSQIEPLKFNLRESAKSAGAFICVSSVAENYFPNSARNFAAISFNASGNTVVFAMTGIKLMSPFQRGTTWMCRCSAMPGARNFAEVDAHVETVRLHQIRQRIHAAARQLPQIRKFVVGQAVEIRNLFVRQIIKWPPT